MKKVTILVKKLVPGAKLPQRAHSGDAGADIFVSSVSRTGMHSLDGGQLTAVCYGSGLAFAVPEGYWLDLRARSSVYKTGQWLCNGVGTIDCGYRGEVKGMFYRLGGACSDGANGNEYAVGDKFAQLIVMPGVSPLDVEFAETDELPETDRGAGGFGSTGK